MGLNTYGQLGEGSNINQSTPISYPPFRTSLNEKTIIAICCGAYHTLALDSTGYLHAWGFNIYSQLGDGTTINRAIPVRIGPYGTLDEKTIKSISCGYYYSIALD